VNAQHDVDLNSESLDLEPSALAIEPLRYTYFYDLYLPTGVDSSASSIVHPREIFRLRSITGSPGLTRGAGGGGKNLCVSSTCGDGEADSGRDVMMIG